MTGCRSGGVDQLNSHAHERRSQPVAGVSSTSGSSPTTPGNGFDFGRVVQAHAAQNARPGVWRRRRVSAAARPRRLWGVAVILILVGSAGAERRAVDTT